MSDEQEIPVTNTENQDQDDELVEVEEENEHYQNPEELTSVKGGPPWFDRKKVLIVIAAVFVVVVISGMIFSSGRKNRNASEDLSGYAANTPIDFLRRELERSQHAPLFEEGEEELTGEAGLPQDTDEWGLPEVTSIPQEQALREQALREQIIREQILREQAESRGRAQTQGQQPRPQLSPLVPAIEGSLFASQGTQEAENGADRPPVQDPYAAALANFQENVPDYSNLLSSLNSSDPLGSSGAFGQGDPYATQNNQADKGEFYSSDSGGEVSGYFLQPNLIWTGTIIPAVLVTAINTDLPGNVIARVTQNIYDSLSGRNLLIPQGSLLVAQYNSSVSYAQHRIQVVWDMLIRPDGYQVALEGMNGVDEKGMAGIKAVYRENWFAYVKAAGIISIFSLINAKMVEQVAKYGTDDMAAGVVTANAEFIKELSGNFIGRAMNIQPTLTVESGEIINIMINKNVRFPPAKNYRVTQKYIRPW